MRTPEISNRGKVFPVVVATALSTASPPQLNEETYAT